jgi:hypothetical protein
LQLSYKESLRPITAFAGEHIAFDVITLPWLNKYESFWLKSMNCTSIGVHMRNLRAIMNEAKKNGVIKESQYPFGKDRYAIKTGESRKKALTLK